MIADRFALQAWAKAASRLAEALAIPPELAPSATAHQAFYAIFHAVRAVLLRATGSAPKKHASGVGQFSSFVRGQSAALKQAARDLNKAEELRIVADYVETRTGSVPEANNALSRAVSFLELCRTEFGFPDVRGPESA